MTTTVIIVAAGKGVRAGGDLPKQYQLLGDRAVLAHTIACFAGFDQIIVVIGANDHALFAQHVAPHLGRSVELVDGGATRAQSVQAGLARVSADQVLIHDGARPLLGQPVIDDVLVALQSNYCAAPALAITDTLWRGNNGAVAATVDRENLYRAQTPQGFHTAAIRAAYAKTPAGDTDDVAVARAAGMTVAITAGDADNLKITTAQDIAQAARILKGNDMDVRTGNGYDVHAFCPGDHVVLCGVKIPHDAGLLGHSDADVAMHAVTDALYGALADGDIGQHFPPSDPQWKGAASDIFLRHATALARARGFTLTHVDCTIICEDPKIGPHAAAMKTNMAALLDIAPDRVSVKATTSEKLGFTGRREGIAAQATATLVKS